MAASRPTGPRPATRQRRPCSQSGVTAASGQRTNLHLQGLVDSFLDDGERLQQDSECLQLGRHLHDVLHVIDDEFLLVSVQSTDASLAVLACLTHIGAIHETRGAFTASPPYGEYSVVASLHASNGRAYVHHLAEHLTPDDELLLTIRSVGAAARYFFAVGATDADPNDPDFDFILRGDG